MYLFRLQYSFLWCLKPTRHTGTRYAWKGVDPDTVEWSRRSDFSNKNCHHKWPISSFRSPAERVENFRPKNMPSASCFEMVRLATRGKASSLCLLGMLSVSKGSIWWSVSPAKMFGCEHDMRYTIYNMIGIWTYHIILEDFLDSNLRMEAVKMMFWKASHNPWQFITAMQCCRGEFNHTPMSRMSDHVGFGWKIWMFEVVWKYFWNQCDCGIHLHQVCVLNWGQQAKKNKRIEVLTCADKTSCIGMLQVIALHGRSWMIYYDFQPLLKVCFRVELTKQHRSYEGLREPCDALH